jgi:hypothetical protein
MPTMFGCSTSLDTRSGVTSTGTNFGMWYRITGTGDASATAVQKSVRAACVIAGA